MDNLWVVEYSVSQKTYHYETLKKCISSNVKSILDKKPTDYLVIGLVNSIEEAQEYIKKFRSEHPEIPQFLMSELVD